jgi:hypothetical protein
MINKTDLESIKNLYFEARDAYNPENSDHSHLKESLLEVAGILHREKVIDDGFYALECEALE